MGERLGRLGRFLRRLFQKTLADEVGLRASAHAFSTLLSLVPLLALMTFFVARTLREDDGRIIDLLTQLLPYREEAITTALRSFLAQTESISGIATLGFVVTTLLTFLGVQDTLFRIFRVERPPSYLRRIVTYSLLFFWGPLLIGSAQAGVLVLSQSNLAMARLVHESALLRMLPGLVTFAGLTMFYWRAAYKHISLRHSAVGALVATVVIELLKQLFGIYVREFAVVQRAVYGTFAITLFFVLSVQIAWWILLLGAEIASCLTAAPASEEEEEVLREADPWIGFAALEQLGEPGRPTLTAGELGEALDLEPDEVAGHLAPLVGAGVVERGLGSTYRLSLPTRQVRLATVMAAYRRLEEREREDHPLPPRIAELRIRLRRSIESELDTTTLAEFLGQEEPPGPDDTIEVPSGPDPESTLAVPVEQLDRPRD